MVKLECNLSYPKAIVILTKHKTKDKYKDDKNYCNNHHKIKIMDSKEFKNNQVKHSRPDIRRSVFSTIHPFSLLCALDKSLHFFFPVWCPNSFSKSAVLDTHSSLFLGQHLRVSVSLNWTPRVPGLPHTKPDPAPSRSPSVTSMWVNQLLTTFTTGRRSTSSRRLSTGRIQSYWSNFRGL